MKTSQLRNIIREELLKELNEVENTEYGSMYSSPQQQQSEMNKLLKQVEELKQMRDDLDRQIDQLEIIANTFNVNEDAAANQAAMAAKKTAIDKEILALNKQKQELSKPGTTLNEEEQLNEMPVYKVADKAGFKKTLDKYRDNPPSKNKALDIILTSLEKHGEVDTQELSKRANKDSATFNNAEIRKFVARPKDEEFMSKSGETLIDFTPFLEKGRAEKTSKADKPAAEPKAKTEKPSATKAEKPTTSTKTEKPAATKPAAAKTEPVDKEDAAATKMAAGVKGGALNKAERYGKLEKEYNRISAELKSLAKDTSPEAMVKRKALSGDKIRIEQAMAKLKQI
jgi:hypothetical protein